MGVHYNRRIMRRPPAKGPNNDTSSRSPIWRELLASTRDSIPIWVGVSPFGLVFGLLGSSMELGPWGTLAMSGFVFAGSAQFIALGLLTSGTSYLAIVLTTLVVNLRHMLYGASLAPHLRSLSTGWRRFLAYGLTDESYAITITRYTRRDQLEHAHWYFLGANANMYLCWMISTALGIWLGDRVPDPAALGLDFALYATLIGLLIPHMKNLAALVVAVAAGCISLATRNLPGKLSILLTTILAASLGLAWDHLFPHRDTPDQANDQPGEIVETAT